MPAARLGFLAAVALLPGCRDKPSAPGVASASGAAEHAPPRQARSVEKDEAPVVRRDAGELVAGELHDVGPAAPATASAHGVVMINKSDEVVVARFAAGKRALEPVESEASSFRAYARGPAVAGDFAYWTSKGRLVRAPVSGGVLESLAEDARDGTRVAALVVGSGKTARAIAVYLARGDEGMLARLWIERVGTWTLTPDGAAATSVALATVGSNVVALSLEGRTGMTPVHARALSFAGATPKLGDDVVAWVAGPAQSVTEIAAAASDRSGVWAFVPLERDITRFGLAQLRLKTVPEMGTPVTWRAYPNGIDPAPLAAGSACGGAYVLYAMPAAAKPRSPQELHWARLGSEGLEASNVIARSRAFSNVSLAEVPAGALVAYVADRRTWATVIRCPS